SGSYTIWETKPSRISNKLAELKKQKVDGFNVTVPYKRTIIPFLDCLDPAAERIGAVNTVVNVNGKWKGDRKSTRLNSSHVSISYAVFCLKKKNDQYMKEA